MTGINITNGNYPAYYYTEHNKSHLWWDENGWMTKDPSNVKLFLTDSDAFAWSTHNGWKVHETLMKTITLPYVIEYNDGPIWQVQRYAISEAAALRYWIENISPKLDRLPVGNELSRTTWRIRHIPTDNTQIMRQPMK